MHRTAAKVLLAGLFAVCIFRAVTQSIVYDEALTYELYIAAPISRIFTYFDPNHHFLSTILMRLSTGLFGVSEWSLRLPALGAAMLYFASVYRLCRVAFGEGWTFLLAVAALSMNPLVLDFMVAARGYGLALALWMCALMLLVTSFSTPVISPKIVALAGTCVALSVTANLIFALPALALAILTPYLLARHGAADGQVPTPAVPADSARRKKNKPAPSSKSASPKTAMPKPGGSKSGMPLWACFLMPMCGVALVYFLVAPVEGMQASQFYTGAATVLRSLRSMASVSVLHSGPLRRLAWMAGWRDALAFGIGPLIVAGGLVSGIAHRSAVLILAAGSVVFSGIALLLLHIVRGMPYPEDRTGIYFLPLVALILIGLAGAERSAAGVSKAASVAAYGLAIVLLVNFTAEFNTRKFFVWEYDADTRNIGEYVARQYALRRPPADAAPLRIGGSWQLWESLNFYRDLNRWNWMEVERVKPEPGFDFYALLQQDRIAEPSMDVREVYVGPVSGSVLTVPRTPAQQSPPR